MNRNNLFLNSPLQNAAEFSGVAGEIRCYSLGRSQNPSGMIEDYRGVVSDPGCSSGFLRLRRKIPLRFGEESLKTDCFDSYVSKSALKPARSAGLRAF
jgi:hypothetical protein